MTQEIRNNFLESVFINLNDENKIVLKLIRKNRAAEFRKELEFIRY